MKFSVGKVIACEPLNELLTLLESRGFVISESRVSDIHFNELYFLLKPENENANTDKIQIENIGKISDEKFYCKCHWSVVELMQK